jgi:hypothetical protein
MCGIKGENYMEEHVTLLIVLLATCCLHCAYLAAPILATNIR